MCWTYPAGHRTSGRWDGSADICSRSRTSALGFAARGFFVYRAQVNQFLSPALQTKLGDLTYSRVVV